MNAALLRAVLTHIESFPALFDTTAYGEAGRGGIVGDIAGRALLLSGWTLTGCNAFRSPDGTREVTLYQGIEDEAQALLGLSADQLWDGGDLDCLFDFGRDEAVRRLRELTEEAEAVRVNG